MFGGKDMTVSSGMRCHVCPCGEVGRATDNDRLYRKQHSGRAAPISWSSDYPVKEEYRPVYERRLFHTCVQGVRTLKDTK